MTWFFQEPAAQANGFIVHREDFLNPLLWGLPTLHCRTVILTQCLIKPCFENPPDIKLPILNTFWLSLSSLEILPPFVRWHSSLEEETATHSSILAWRIPWTEEPGRLPSIGSQKVGHDLVTKQHSRQIFHTLLTAKTFTLLLLVGILTYMKINLSRALKMLLMPQSILMNLL